jgi:hypothetical protein
MTIINRRYYSNHKWQVAVVSFEGSEKVAENTSHAVHEDVVRYLYSGGIWLASRQGFWMSWLRCWLLSRFCRRMMEKLAAVVINAEPSAVMLQVLRFLSHFFTFTLEWNMADKTIPSVHILLFILFNQNVWEYRGGGSRYQIVTRGGRGTGEVEKHCANAINRPSTEWTVP